MFAASNLNNSNTHITCPMLVPLNFDLTCFDGFISVKGTDYRFRIETDGKDILKNARIFGDWKLHHQLRDYRDLITSRLQSAPNLDMFLVELKTILERTTKTTEMKYDVHLHDVSFIRKIMEEIEQVGWQKIFPVDSTFLNLKLTCSCENNQEHTLQIHLSNQYPKQPPDCSADLPDTFVLHWTEKNTLATILHQFQDCIKKFQDFWTQMTEIDEKCVVIEPEQPRRSDKNRRIAIGNNCSIEVCVDPYHPRMLPECRFLGADHVVTPLRQKLNTSLSEWNSHSSLLANLQAILDVDFPEKSSQSKQEFSTECGICYCYRLESGIPDAVCDNPQCNKPFHKVCLYEWLRSLPSGNQTMSKLRLNSAFGECPYCGKQITVKKPD